MSRRCDAAGFTLLELLVAMTVLAVLTGLLATTVSFGARIWEREQTQLEQWAELQMVQDVIRRTLGEAWPLSMPTGTETQNAEFVGGRTSINSARRRRRAWSAGSINTACLAEPAHKA